MTSSMNLVFYIDGDPRELKFYTKQPLVAMHTIGTVKQSNAIIVWASYDNGFHTVPSSS